MPVDSRESLECRATAAVLRSGESVALAGDVAAIISAVSIWHRLNWVSFCALLVWFAVVYLSIRVKIDASFFELLATYPADQFDRWLHDSGLRTNPPLRSMMDRQRGALRLWRALVASLVVELALMTLGMVQLLR